ncbi:MAG: tetratricopeptide repeat protein [Halarsenatibacteraceae bacterium]
MKKRNFLMVFVLLFVFVGGMTLQINGASLNQAMEYFNDADYENAASELSDLIEEGEESWQAYYFAGLSYNYIGQSETAIPYFRNAYELRPDDYRTVVNYSRALYRADSYDLAYEVLSDYDGDILDTQYHNLLGLIYMAEEDIEAAESAYLEAIEYGDNPYVYNNLGLLLLEEGRYEESVEYLAQAVELEPTEAYIYNNYGLALLNTGAEAEAVEAFEKALEIDPDYRKAENNLNRIQGE